jgi:hypothetical protein
MVLGYKGQNLAVYNCEFLEMLRHWKCFVVRWETIYNKKEPQ